LPSRAADLEAVHALLDGMRRLKLVSICGNLKIFADYVRTMTL
jgi:hypothetical protein